MLLGYLISLQKKGIKLWVNDEKIGLFLPDNTIFSEEDKYFIKENKRNILEILRINNIFSKKDFDRSILKLPDNRKSELSFAQERLWFIDRYEDGTHAFNVPIILQLNEGLDREILKKSLVQIVERHEILRTIFRQDETGIDYQKVLNEPLDIQEVELSLSDFNTLIKHDINFIFNLTKQYPIKVKFYNVENTYYLLINIHHIAFDGWSMNIFLKELKMFYYHYKNKDLLELPKLTVQYRDFAVWQRKYLSNDEIAGQIEYWREKLANFEPLALVTDKTRPNAIDYRGEDITFKLGEKLSGQIKKLAQTKGTTPFIILLSGFYILLNKYTGQTDLVVGTAIANRHYAQLEHLIGFFVNSLALRAVFDEKKSIDDLTSHVHHMMVDAQNYQDLPFEKLVEELKVEQDLNRHPIFQVFFEVHSFGDQKLQNKLFSSMPISESYKVAKYDLRLLIDDSTQDFQGVVNYAVSLFEQKTMERLAKHYVYILEQLVANSAQAIKDVKVVLPEEYDLMIRQWNETDKIYHNDRTIVELFEAQVEKTPDVVSVAFEGQSLTYKELNEKANQLAQYIRYEHHKFTQESMQPDTLVAIYMDRSLDMLISIMAILKAGGAYVSIDPEYPEDRIAFILEDTTSKLVLTNKRFEHTLKKININICLITVDQEPYINEIKNNLDKQINSTNLSYVIYTSGTTGKPKGVMVEHRSVVNYINNINTHYLPGHKNVDFSSSLSFDLTVTTTLGSLLLGHTIYIYSGRLDDISAYLHHLNSHKIQFIKMVPALYQLVSQALDSETTLREVVLGGEKLNRHNLTHHKKVRIYDEYGPTEATVGSLLSTIDPDNQPGIGKAYDNYRLYVLNSHLGVVPLGAIGELYIGGAGLARGYINRPELTAERFIVNLFMTEEDQRKGYTKLYKTGDLVRWLPDGNMEYIGRNDSQVKLRGFRIELGEIEQVMSRYPNITHAAVLLRETEGNKYLVGYYVSEKEVNEEELRSYLAEILPSYMIPSVFARLDKFPLTVNGKLDRKALPNSDLKLTEGYVAPKDELQAKLCEIWGEVLGLARIGVNDDFFRIGGDSILSIQLTSRLRNQGLSCSIKSIFENRTIEQLSNYLKSVRNEGKIEADQGILNGKFGLLPIQKWFFESAFRQINHWNQSFLVKVPELDQDILKEVIGKLVEHHDALRLRYEGQVQKYHSTIELPKLQVLNRGGLSDEALQTILTDWQSHFDIEKGPLWQISYIYGYKDKTARIYFAFHHLIIDAVSWRILTEDVKALYEGATLQKKTSSYKQWIEAITSYAKNHEAEGEYWDKVLKNQTITYPGVINETMTHQIKLSKALTQDLVQRANKVYNTEINDLLLAALSYTLQEWTGLEANYITLEGHGREHINDQIDVSRTIGWFTTMYPVKLQAENNISSTIKNIKENLRRIPNKGIGYGALKGKVYPPISFNYLGQFDKQEGLWQIIGEKAGISISQENQDANIININGLIVGGELQFILMTKLTQQEGVNFTKLFQHSLEKIIEHCNDKVKIGKTEYTPADFPTVKLSQSLLDKLSNEYDIEAIYSANSLQQGFIYHVLSQPNDDAYRVQLLFDYHNYLNIKFYRQAWEMAIANYPILRTCFNWEEELIQIINKKGKIIWEEHDISQAENKEIALQKIKENDRNQPFDLRQLGLLRIHVIKQGSNEYTVLKSEHHAIGDGWSWPILLGRVHEFYKSLLQNKYVLIKQEEVYLEVQKYYAKHKEEVEKYWKEKLKKEIRANNLSLLLDKKIDLNSIKVIEDFSSEKIIIQGNNYKVLKRLAKKEGLTLSVIIQYAWHKLIKTYIQEDKTIVGTVVSGRGIAVKGIENSVGLYINTLPLIVDWSENTTLNKMKEIHQSIMELDNYSAINLATLQKEGKRLFHSLFVFENYPIPHDSDVLKMEFREAVEKLDYPLALISYEVENTLHIKLNYAGEFLENNKAKRLLRQINFILEKLPNSLDSSHENLNIIEEEEYQKTVYEWNKTDKQYSNNKMIHQLFEEQAEKNPTNIALVFEENTITYEELNVRANQVAWKIGLQSPDTLIPICIERSLEMIIGILGILKTGAAYVPIDPTSPQERIKFILEEIGSNVIVNKKFIAQSTIEEKVNLTQEFSPKNLAYVIYTSGTTGQPKGVLQTHENVVRLFHAAEENYQFTNDDVWTLFHAYTFDFSVWEVWGALFYGAKLIIPSHEETRDTSKFFNLCNKHEVTVLNQTPLAFYQFIEEACHHKERLKKLKYVIFGGDTLNVERLNPWWDYYGSETPKLINMYGITETTVHVTYKELSRSEVNTGSNIGHALEDLKVYVLDHHLKPLPIGIVGELYVGGAGLARGYLNRPELTAERFIENPYATEEDKKKGYTRLYKTGDLVKWLLDGDLEYLGRNDAQVKLRGFRIELGEIENKLLNYDGVKQSVVVLREREENKYLIGYYVAKEKINEAELKSYLELNLPEYMVPSVLVYLESLPLTINGKLDHKALPNPEFKNLEEGYVAPRDEHEAKLCHIWREVLGLQRIGVQDDFFKIGGDSISAIRVIHKMSRILERDILVSDLFKYKTIATLKNSILNNSQSVNIQHLNTDTGILSFAQERLWFIERYEQGTNAYHIPIVLELLEGIELDAFKQSIKSIVNRHEILRTVLKQDDAGKDYQLVLDKPLFIEEIAVSAAVFTTNLKKNINDNFDLFNNYPIKVTLYKVNEKNYALINIHHIAFDGWSMDIFIRELTAYYQHYNEGLPLELPKLDIQYKDFARWQREYLKKAVLEKQVNYWKQELSGCESLNIPTDKPRPSHIDYHGDEVEFELDTMLSIRLRKLAQAKGVTLYTVLLSGFYVLLNKYTSQEDIVIGTPIANRHYAQLENLIGFFVNSLVLRARVHGDKNFNTLIEETHDGMIRAQAHQDLPFEKLVDALEVEQDLSRHPIFQVMFSVQSFGSSKESKAQKKIFKSLNVIEHYEVAKFDLSLFIADDQENLQASFNYATSLFKRETIERLAKHYEYVLTQLLDNQEEPVRNLIALLPEEYKEVIHQWNKTDRPYPEDKTIHELFEAQVEQCPEAVAVTFEGQTLSYRALNEKSNQLARYIRRTYEEETSTSFKADTLIGICVERSLEMVIGILGILKAGGAYVPIDPSYPDERIAFMLEDIGSQLLLTQSGLSEPLASSASHVKQILLDRKPYAQEDASNLSKCSEPKDLAYVIYTSGTTGKPKGVMNYHFSLVNRLEWMRVEYGFNATDNILQKTPYVFDVSVWELLLPFISAAKLVIMSPEAHKLPDKIYQIIAEENITRLHFVPSMLEAYMHFTQSLREGELVQHHKLRSVFCSGEELKIDTYRLFQSYYGDVELHNLYGPTEAAIDVTSYPCSLSAEKVYIGKAIQNIKLYVLNAALQPVPIGVAGELYLGGAGLARGYLNRPELTSERFIKNPYATEADQEKGYTRLYKTGDLVKWLADGNLEYLGRNDSQVKLRGFRIELGEIEHKLSNYEGVRQSVVVLKEREGSKYLVGYYVAEENVDEAELRSYLEISLPEYMVPSVLVVLESLPLTINGKLDRKALPNPEFKNLEESYVAPRDEYEAKLCRIWGEVLGLERVGIKDDFFKIGGDSILSIQLISKLRSQGSEFSIKSIFEYRTIEKLIHYNRVTENQIKIEAEQGVLTGEFELLPIQEWFFESRFNHPNHWNQSFLVKVPELEINKLKKVIIKLAKHHDALSLKYQNRIQRFDKERIIPELKVLHRKELNETELESYLTNWQSNFDIEKGPLWQIGYIDGYADGTARIYFAFHHLIIDAVSWRILIEDVKTLYEGKELPKKTSSYRQWVKAVKSYANIYQNELNYWVEIISSQIQIYVGEKNKIEESFLVLSESLTKNLLQDATHAYHTEINDLLLTALAYTLKAWTNSNENHITLEGHGREMIDENIDVSGTIGWFTSMCPVRLRVHPNISESIKIIKEDLRKIPMKGLGYGALKYSDHENQLKHHKLPPISFNYLGQFDSKKGLWQVIGESSGYSISPKNQSVNIIDINGWIMHGQLQFSVKTQLQENFSKIFVENFERYLKEIIEHCMNIVMMKKSEYTMSDLTIDENTLVLADSIINYEHTYFSREFLDDNE